MRKLLVLFIVISSALIISCAGEEKKSSKSTASSKPKVKKVDGAKIYKMNCVICHGADGKLGINGAKDITVSELTMEEKITLITKGKGVMTPFETILKPEQIKAVAEYSSSL